ncbi:DNA-3-methyladenine glycosylase [Corynebacterium resistens]|uniref:DNA-3-methyladenine glycosylase n=1 Tax=Corynebacterium resistens TaxID=258224 RepID=UPI0023569547|nr:DNA-3-methyladenine glycosylase [Corynebacterium resistens]
MIDGVSNASHDALIDFDASADIVAPQLLGGILRLGDVAIRITEVEAYLGESDPASHAYKGPTPRCATMFGPSSRLYVYASYGIHRAGTLVCQPEGIAGGVLLRGGEVIDGYEVARHRRGPKASDVALARGPGNLGQAMGFDLELNGAEIRQGRAPEEVSAFGSSEAPASPETPGLPKALDSPAVSDSSVSPDGFDSPVSPDGSGSSPDGLDSPDLPVLPNPSVVVDPPILYFQRAPEPVSFVAGKRIGISKNVDAPLRFWIPGDPTVSSPRGRTRK